MTVAVGGKSAVSSAVLLLGVTVTDSNASSSWAAQLLAASVERVLAVGDLAWEDIGILLGIDVAVPRYCSSFTKQREGKVALLRSRGPVVGNLRGFDGGVAAEPGEEVGFLNVERGVTSGDANGGTSEARITCLC
mmetsp:Transcript_51464/g.92425  ORF Transcript_51464/g.92425 Transcript_51464/m.92425 type:complete len:135 (+) Transcript_51464:1256-1660(+)